MTSYSKLTKGPRAVKVKLHKANAMCGLAAVFVEAQ
jgi:hypothetical protein